MDFIPNQILKNDNSKIENNNLNSDNKYIELEKKLNDEKNKNKYLEKRIKNLENKLKNKNEEISKLQNLINLQNKQIFELKLNNNSPNNNSLYNIKPGEKIFSINFASIDQNIIHYSLTCKNTDIFVRLEEQLYEDYPEYKDKETYFMINAKKIKRFKSLDENNIKKNDVLMLYTYDE